MKAWNQMHCPYCKVVNWLYGGDLDDITMPDIEACECHKCGNRFLTPYMEEEAAYRDFENYGFKDKEDYIANGAYCEKGLPNPSYKEEPHRLICRKSSEVTPYVLTVRHMGMEMFIYSSQDLGIMRLKMRAAKDLFGCECKCEGFED